MLDPQLDEPTPPARRVSASGLKEAMGIVIIAVTLILSILLLIVGPSEQRGTGIVMAAGTALLLAGWAWRRRDLAAAEDARARERKELTRRDLMQLEIFLAVILVGQLVAVALVAGPDRGRFAVGIAIVVVALVRSERTRRARRP